MVDVNFFGGAGSLDSGELGGVQLLIDDLLKKLMRRCSELHLAVAESESHAVLKISAYTTTLVMNYLYTGRLRGHKCTKN